MNVNERTNHVTAIFGRHGGKGNWKHGVFRAPQEASLFPHLIYSCNSIKANKYIFLSLYNNKLLIVLFYQSDLTAGDELTSFGCLSGSDLLIIKTAAIFYYWCSKPGKLYVARHEYES